MTHICVRKLTIIVSDNGLLPGLHQAIIWTNAGTLLIQTLETIFNEILSKINTFSFKKMHLKMSVCEMVIDIACDIMALQGLTWHFTI